MTKIQIAVTGAEAVASVEGILTGGMAGVPVTFLFDDTWEELSKTAVFKAGSCQVCVPGIAEQVVLPWEVLLAGCTVYIGVYGVSEDGTLAIPTVWAQVAEVLPGADPEGDPAMAPTAPVWKQAMDKADAVYNAARAGEFDGYSPVRGVDYWTPEDIAHVKGYVESAILGGAW